MPYQKLSDLPKLVRQHLPKHAHEDIYVAIRDAFDAAKRQLEDYVRIRRGDTKSHKTTSRGSREKRGVDKLED